VKDLVPGDIVLLVGGTVSEAQMAINCKARQMIGT
jgi:hypothetical protein